MRFLLLFLPVLATACAGSAPVPERYTGAAPACGRAEGGGETATLAVLGAGFAFAPYDGSLVVNGQVAAGRTLTGTLDLHPAQAASARSASKPATRAAQTVSVTGRLTPDAAQLAYAAPGCSAGITLARVRPPVF